MTEYKELFPNLADPRLLNFVVRMLNGVSRFIGYPIGIIIPPDIAEFKGQPEQLRALRLLSKLRDQGIIKSFHTETSEYSDEPQSHVTFARLVDIKRFGFSGKGAHLSDRSATLWPALGEAVERYATQFNYPQEGEYIDASWNELKKPKADIFSIAGFDENLRKKGNSVFNLTYDQNSKFRWVKAISLPDKKEIWAPLQFFSFTHIQKFVQKYGNGEEGEKEPLLSIPITTGAAAGQNMTDATLRGLLEIIERDAFMIYWLNQIPAKKIDLSSFKEDRFQILQDTANRYGLEIHLLYLQTDMPVHTVCSIVIDRSGVGPALVIGAKSGLVLSDVAYDAFGETLAQRSIYRRMMDTNKNKDATFDDISKINHEGRMYYWFRHECLKDLEKFISGEISDVKTFPVLNYSGDTKKDLAQLLQTFTEKGYEVFCRELLSPKFKKLTEGLSVVMVKVPQMQPVYLEEGLRSIGGERLRSVPKMLGHGVKESEDPFCAIPHPFP